MLVFEESKGVKTLKSFVNRIAWYLAVDDGQGLNYRNVLLLNCRGQAHVAVDPSDRDVNHGLQPEEGKYKICLHPQANPPGFVIVLQIYPHEIQQKRMLGRRMLLS
jgi:hypothetical protein